MKHIFIINPVAGNEDRSEEIRREAEALSAQLGLDSLFFIVEYEGNEAQITEKVCDAFRGEKIRLYACGGSGTFQRVMEAAKSFKDIELAVYPCGFTNDILKCFKDSEPFYKLKNIVTGEPLEIDVAEFDGIRFCNALSIGMTARIICDKDSYAFITKFHRNFPYWVSSIVDVLSKHAIEYEIDIDGKDYSGKYLIVSAFNGCVFGGNISPAKNAKPDDGYLDFVMFKKVGTFQAAMCIKPFCSGDVEKLGDKIIVVRGKKMKIRQVDSKGMTCNIDGEFYETSGVTEISIKHNGLKIIVPKGTEFK